jgi:Fe-Mn family superoxide dismutase
VTASADRRGFLNGLIGAGAGAGAAAAGAYDLPALPYDYAALEPNIDAATMKFHHDFHHNTYITGINGALEGKPQPPLAELQVGAIKSGVKGIRNSGGGAYNHDLFWEAMSPPGKGGSPSAELAAAIDAAFGSMDEFKTKWAAAAAPAARFGSGWVWLIVREGKVDITDTPNQDNPLMKGVEAKEGIPILGLDVWEHAYYLKYQNRRPEYVSAFWDIVNWNKVNQWYATAISGGGPPQF